MKLELDDKNIFISASSDGTGRAIAESFLAEGANVSINGRDEKKLVKCHDELVKVYGHHVNTICADASEENGISKIAEELSQKHQALDGLVCCLGSGKPMEQDKLAPREWQGLMNINLYSAESLVRKLLPLMKIAKSSSIVFISSIAAKEYNGAPYAYAAAKGGILTLAKYLSHDFAQFGIRVNTVMPGNIFYEGGRWDELVQQDEAGVKKYIDGNVPMKRFATTKEIADAVVFLSSARSSFTTGAVLTVDGGQMLGY